MNQYTSLCSHFLLRQEVAQLVEKVDFAREASI